MPMQVLRWHRHHSPEAAAAAVVEGLAACAARAVAERGVFHVVLSGGSTPRPVYEAAKALPAQWSAWRVYFADERCLPSGHPGRNDALARRVWLDHVSVPAHAIHFIRGELGPEAGAAAYREVLAGVGSFDLVLLGLGEDGHTASLFPGHPTGATPESPTVLAVRDAPKPPPERISLSAARLARAESVYLMVLGASKRAAVRAWREGAPLPIAAVKPANGIDIHIDTEAASGANDA